MRNSCGLWVKIGSIYKPKWPSITKILEYHVVPELMWPSTNWLCNEKEDQIIFKFMNQTAWKYQTMKAHKGLSSRKYDIKSKYQNIPSADFFWTNNNSFSTKLETSYNLRTGICFKKLLRNNCNCPTWI